MSVSLLSPLAPLPGGLPHSQSCSLALNRDDIQAQPLPQPLPGSQILMYNSSSIDLQIDTLSVPQVQVKLITPCIPIFKPFLSFCVLSKLSELIQEPGKTSIFLPPDELHSSLNNPTFLTSLLTSCDHYRLITTHPPNCFPLWISFIHANLIL